MVVSLLIMAGLGKITITSKQFKLIATVISLILISTILLYLFKNDWINDKVIVLSLIKFTFYLGSLVLFYNFIVDNELKNVFLNINNYAAVIIILIGIIFTILIYLDNVELVREFWMFTRQDYKSYFYGGNADIIRTRSIFSEPAHLGFYLNVLFFSNVFYSKSKNSILLLIFAIGIFTTLSYSMILIFLFIGSIILFKRIYENKFFLNKWYLLLIIPISLLLVYFWEFVEVTIIKRTINIVNGIDGSAYNRIIESWTYVDPDRLLYGNGIGHTPPITNIYAYALSDFGLVVFIPLLIFSGILFLNSFPAALLFIALNVSKGGYLNPAFWLFLLFIYLYILKPNQKIT